MNAEQRALAELVSDILSDYCTPVQLAAACGRADPDLWRVLTETGLTAVGVAERAGGSGAGLVEACIVVRAIGEYGAPAPVAEASMLAGWLLEASGAAQLPEGMITAGVGNLTAVPEDNGWRVRGRLGRVAYGRDADWVVALARHEQQTFAVIIPARDCVIRAGENVAGEPRDDIETDCTLAAASVLPAPASAAAELRLRGALSRATLIAGGLTRALGQTISHVTVRDQFGRPISKFQAVQQQLALMAGEVNAASAAAEAAARVCAECGPVSEQGTLAVAAAKVRAAQAASMAASIAHQMHGAIGMTHEHALRFTTTRLWSWRAEWGGEAEWAQELGRMALDMPEKLLWPSLVGG